jgi:hypothetical protein
VCSAIIAVAYTAEIEKVFLFQVEALAFAGAAILMEIIKRATPALRKIVFRKRVEKSFLDIVRYVPLFRAVERSDFGRSSSTAERFLLAEISTPYLESQIFGIGIVTIVLWSIIIWYFCST